MRRFAIAFTLAVPLVACTSTPEPMTVTIEVDRPSNAPEPIELSVGGRDFEETVAIVQGQDNARIVVPGPGDYIIRAGGTTEESTGPTSGYQWYAEALTVEVSEPVTVTLRVSEVCA